MRKKTAATEKQRPRPLGEEARHEPLVQLIPRKVGDCLDAFHRGARATLHSIDKGSAPAEFAGHETSAPQRSTGSRLFFALCICVDCSARGAFVGGAAARGGRALPCPISACLAANGKPEGCACARWTRLCAVPLDACKRCSGALAAPASGERAFFLACQDSAAPHAPALNAHVTHRLSFAGASARRACGTPWVRLCPS